MFVYKSADLKFKNLAATLKGLIKTLLKIMTVDDVDDDFSSSSHGDDPLNLFIGTSL